METLHKKTKTPQKQNHMKMIKQDKTTGKE